MNDKLLEEGIELFRVIIKDLNKLNIRKADNYRRDVDWKEICLALALHERKRRG